MVQELLRFLSLADANVRYVLLGSLLLGACSGLVGVFAVLRKQSLLGDALAHAALPGIVLGFMLTLSKSHVALLTGAAVAGLVGVLAIMGIVRMGRIKEDAAIGIILSVFFGLGILLLTHIQRLPSGNQSGLDKYIFGQAASLLPADIKLIGGVALIALITVVLLFKEFRLLVFDAQFLRAQGFPVPWLDVLLMFLIVLVVMTGLQAVGVVLIAALLITPAAAARFWTDSLTVMLLLSTLFGALSGMLGALFSTLAPAVPTGPVIVLAATLFFAISAVSAPQRGWLAKLLRSMANQKQSAREHFLRAVLEWQEAHAGKQSFSPADLSKRLALPLRAIGKTADELLKLGLLHRHPAGLQLTVSGRSLALSILKSHRLWEYYLLHRMSLQKDHVHRDADAVEHILSADMIAELENVLARDGVDLRHIDSLHNSSH